MRILAKFPFNNGEAYIKKHFPILLKEVESAIEKVDASKCLIKKSKEKTMRGKMLYSPVALNEEFKKQLFPRGWKNVKASCEYPTKYYIKGYNPKERKIYPFRDMDFVKNKLGIEVQFGKYSFMVYNVCAKMTIFKNLGHIKAGIEIVPIKELANQMSTGVSYFEQFVWDLEHRGVSNIDVPTLIIGIGA